MNRDEYMYEMHIELDYKQVVLFYTTMKKCHETWGGGNPEEQDLLRELKEQSWKLMLESQFDGPSDTEG